MTITLTVSGRIASVDATAHVVAGNTYPVALSLDSEWTGSLYLRVRFGSLYYDIPFASSDASVDVQMPVGYPEVGIGVFSEALEICSNEARIRLLRSILEAGEQVVEFDSDLYDQWAGEVSELLCDDAFDAESDRPVKNSVITAWKNTVPLDSALVHKTGNETINGNKTFTARMFVREPSIPSIHVVSETAYTATGWKGLVGFFDQKDGANNEAAGIYTSVASGEINLGLRVHKPSRSGQFDTIIRSYDDHQIIITTPYYPTDSGGNPQPIGANALITSGNVAVDPRLVHTTGNESIAGNKTFLANIAITGTVPIYKTESTLDFTQGATKGVYSMRAKNGSGQTVDYATASLLHTTSGSGERMEMAVKVFSPSYAISPTVSIRAMADGTSRVLVPSHLPTGSGGTHLAPDNTEVINSEMLAVDPRVVHTTGNETVAGTKTLAGTVNANGALVVNGDLNTGLYKSAVTSIQQGKWVEFATISDMVEGLFYLTFSDPTNYMNDVRGLVAIICRPSQNIVVFRWIAGRCATPEDFAITTDPTNNMGHVWFMKRGVYGTPCLIRLAEHNYLTPRTRVLNGTDTNNYDEIPVPTGGRVTYSTKEDWMS